MRLRPAQAADIPAMMALEHQSPAAAHWSPEQYEKLFEPSKVSQPSTRCAWIAEHGEAPAMVGLLVSHHIDAEWELENVVVAESARRLGVGTLLLNQLIAHARSHGGAAIFLEVRESNQNARAFYRKFGFHEHGLRKCYYSHPTEDALLYRLTL